MTSWMWEVLVSALSVVGLVYWFWWMLAQRPPVVWDPRSGHWRAQRCMAKGCRHA